MSPVKPHEFVNAFSVDGRTYSDKTILVYVGLGV